MSNLQKTVIMPIVAVFAMVFQLVVGVEIGEDVQQSIVTGLGILIPAVVSVWGIVKNHKK